MQRIVPNIWFDHNAAEAAEFYTSAFPDARVIESVRYPSEGLPDFQADMAGEVLTVELEIGGYRLLGINAGAEFRPNPSVSFFVNFDPAHDPDATQHLDDLWAKLSDGGNALMPLQAYDFSPHYGWIEDRYGVNWQLMLTTPAGGPRPFLVPCLLFTTTVQGRAKEAIGFYTWLFEGSVGTVATYPETAGDVAGEVMFADFELAGQWFAAMDSAGHTFGFTPGVSLMVSCDDQVELDRLWNELSAVPEAEQCGWCTDKFGLSWQLVPTDMADLMSTPGAYEKLMGMKKIEISDFG
ncbi:VOC family protein [Propionicimonas sp.]|uniref:VOC family protein n=1 Tax=Propionicimonas sp. TaxID=1955623 RepID=UPI0039E2309E